ncbi:serine/threonine-protein kinase [Micromonosporaceae bacterium Da 78-11]
MPQPGEMIGDRYRLDGRIAAGGMGEVWRATDTVLGRDVAVKTLHAGQAADPGFQTRFRHEARAMAALHHPGIADVYDYGQTGDGADAYIVMARVVGRPLNDLLAERGRFGAAETMSIVAQAGRALEAAHQAGIVHRDVKPGNLVIRPDGTVVLVDFGVARSAESAALTGVQEVVGTALYIAPEQVSKQTVGPAADMYALGTVAFHCLAGYPPFQGDNPIGVAMQHLSDEPPELPADVPGPVRALVVRAMAKNPAARYPSAAAMADAAEHALAGGTAATMAGGAELAALAGSPPRGFAPGPASTSGLARGVVSTGGVNRGVASSGGFTPGVAPAGGYAPGAAAAGAAAAGGYAVGRAGSGAPVRPANSGHTSVMPAAAAPAGSPGYDAPAGGGPGGGAGGGGFGRRGLVLAGTLAALAVAVVVGVVALMDQGGDDPAPVSPSTVSTPGRTPSTTKKGGTSTKGNQNNNSTKTATGKPSNTSSATASASASSDESPTASSTPSTAPATTKPTTAATTTTTTEPANPPTEGDDVDQPKP